MDLDANSIAILAKEEERFTDEEVEVRFAEPSSSQTPPED